jgi:hypothetical protein
MGGASIALPQDLTSAINGNPATLTQFYGTQFIFGGAWAKPTYNLAHLQGALPTLGTFSAKSEAQGELMGNIGITQARFHAHSPSSMRGRPWMDKSTLARQKRRLKQKGTGSEHDHVRTTKQHCREVPVPF